MNVLDLFSGIGGFSLGLERAGMRTVAFCEIEDYPRRVLARHWPDVPIHHDIRELDGEQYRGTVDLVCGGPPCQPVSLLGQRRGEDDDRFLWDEYFRILSEVRPAWAIAENPIGLASMGLDKVLTDLADRGYETEVFDIPACGVNAQHERRRLWILAHSDSARLQRQRSSDLSGRDRAERHRWPDFERNATPRVCRGTDGISRRVDRLRALGNAVVPQIPEIIGRAILEAETTSPKDD